MANRVHSASPVVNNEVKCYRHPEIALPRRISKTEKNPGRAFYSCEVKIKDNKGNDGATCNFFKWEDELPIATPPSSQTAASPFNPQTPSKRPASNSEQDSGRPPKRQNTSTPTSSPQRTPASQARLQAILSAQEQSSPALEAGTSPRFTPAVQNNIPTPSSSPSTSQSSTSAAFDPGRRPTSPSARYQPTTPPPTAERTGRLWPPQTPPSVRLSAAQSEHLDGSRENRNININGMPDNIFCVAEAVRLDEQSNLPTGRPTGSASSEPRGPVASHSLGSADGEAEEPDAADELLDYSQRLAAHIKHLKRRLESADKQNNAKACKIEVMQAEIDRLKLRNDELERCLADLS
ncbi:hypothetical protein R3P38DRAFT_3039256 [Favolaschia claudopus]|uniref:GRF-type domain-containing protein n=1 Tax=Favolaschia claudopus TaxID=2862362 RepID=A0AAW0A9E5_9AGAR